VFVSGASIRRARVLQGKAGSFHSTRDVDELGLFVKLSCFFTSLQRVDMFFKVALRL